MSTATSSQPSALVANERGNVVIVTGGAGLIGSALCESLGQEGFEVVMVDINNESLAKAADSFQDSVGRSCMTIASDISSQQGARQAVDEVLRVHGRVDALVNNAATKSSSPTDFFTADVDYAQSTWREVMATNLDGAFFMTQAAGRDMLSRGSGNIVNIASIYGLVGADQRIYAGSEYLGLSISTPAVYAASKAGLLGLTRHFAASWGSRGVRVNAVTPGGVESGQNETFTKNYGARVPLGRMARLAEVVAAVKFLVSSEASYVNGHNLVVDGGLTAW